MNRTRYRPQWLQALVIVLSLGVVPMAFAGRADDSGRDGPNARGRARLVVFGDSLSDPGNYYIAFGETSVAPYAPVPSAPYDVDGHRFTNGETWVEQLADRLDTPQSGSPALQRPGVFTNYAVGRARARPGAPEFAAFDLSTQVGLFMNDFRGQSPADATYVIWIGANDLDDALGALATDPTGAASGAIIQAALSSIASNIVALWSTGARHFLIPDMPDLSITPVVQSLGPQAGAAASALTGAFNGGLDAVIAQLQGLPQIRLLRLDDAAVLESVLADPDAFHFADVTDACLQFGVTVDAICDHPRDFLFWDGLHPTRHGHAVVAREAFEVLRRAR